MFTISPLKETFVGLGLHGQMECVPGHRQLMGQREGPGKHSAHCKWPGSWDMKGNEEGQKVTALRMCTSRKERECFWKESEIVCV